MKEKNAKHADRMEENGMRMLDMHAHLFCLTEGRAEKNFAMRELVFRAQHGIGTFFSCGTPQEWEFMQRLREDRAYPKLQGGENRNLQSFGIHPWYSESFRPEDWMEYFRACDAVGEIGMDSVWCEVPLPVQKEILQRQLAIAAALGKPVILHTKGQEREIARMVRTFPGKICVHWYSGDIRVFEEFLALDCYFTLGPDLAQNGRSCSGIEGAAADSGGSGMEGAAADSDKSGMEGAAADSDKSGMDAAAAGNGSSGPALLPEDRASGALYRHMLGRIPGDRLFLETDGLSAVAWARGRKQADLKELPEVLKENLAFLAAVRGTAPGRLQEQMWKNLDEFLGKKEKIS